MQCPARHPSGRALNLVWHPSGTARK